MLYPIIALCVGFIALALSADRFTASAAEIAEHFGMSQLMIGLTIVAFGTSAPEIIVSINAALNHSGALALGNAIGSNIVNTGVVLGVTAIIFPIVTSWSSIKNEISLLLAICVVAAVLLIDGSFTQTDGFVLFIALTVSCFIIVKSKLNEQRLNKSVNLDIDEVENNPEHPGLFKDVMAFIVFLGLLIGSANLLVWGAKEIAEYYKVNELVIGLTIVAIGTSLPELAASVASALKKQHDIALGNIIGSNIFNVGAVIGIAGIIETFEVPPAAMLRDFSFMMLLIVILFIISIAPKILKQSDTVHFGRLIGFIFILCYISYSVVLLKASL